MIKFVVCDDQKEFRDKLVMSINKLLMNNNVEFEIDEFSKFDKKFDQIIKLNDCSKIYILDIEIPNSISGIDIARKIRKNDWKSIIIMITSHSELGYEALKAQIMLLDFISKYDNCKENTENVLKKAIAKVDDKKIIFLESSGILHRVYIDDIVYVIKDTVDRKCIIRTSYSEIVVNKTMNEMIRDLDDRFYQSHRSCLVNTNKISSVDFKNNYINFDNGDSIDLLSRDKKKGLKEYVGMD